MAVKNNNRSNLNSPQQILQQSFDPDYEVLVTENLNYNPTTGALDRATKVNALQTLIDNASATITYVGKNSSSSAPTSAITWEVTKIDTTTNPNSIKKAVGSWDGRVALF